MPSLGLDCRYSYGETSTVGYGDTTIVHDMGTMLVHDTGTMVVHPSGGGRGGAVPAFHALLAGGGIDGDPESGGAAGEGGEAQWGATAVVHGERETVSVCVGGYMLSV